MLLSCLSVRFCGFYVLTCIICRMRVWLFPRKTRYTAAEALDYLRQRKVVPSGPPEAERITSANST